MRAGHGEPYPALMMPAFAGTRTAPGGSIGVTSIEAIVRFSDGTATPLPIKTLLAPIPRTTTMEASEHVFRRPAVPTSDLVRWLRDRVGGLFPGRPVVGFEVHWYQDAYRTDEGRLRRVAHTPAEIYVVDLTR